jgi:hypothetical protein
MFSNFFDAPDFLSLLAFWEQSRDARGLARFADGGQSRIPADLLPNVIVADWADEPRYRLVGSECKMRFGIDTTGQPVFGILEGIYADYIRSLGDEVVRRAAPIFSASVFEAEGEVMLTGRLYAPFATPDATAPDMLMSVQLFSEARFKLSAVARAGFVTETERLLIVGVPELCRLLEEARRYRLLAGIARARRETTRWDEYARDISGRVLVPLAPFRALGAA